MDRQTDRQACENNGLIETQACEQDGMAFLERGFGKEWKNKLRERLLNRMSDKLRNRLVSRNQRKIKRQACEKDGKTNLAKFLFFLFCFDCFASFRLFPV